MANEVTVTGSLSVTEAGITKTVAKTAAQYDLATTPTKFQEHIQDVGTSEEALDMGDITAPGWFYLENLDATNFVQVYAATAETSFAKLLPGEFIMGKLEATAPVVKADTASCKVRFFLYQA